MACWTALIGRLAVLASSRRDRWQSPGSRSKHLTEGYPQPTEPVNETFPTSRSGSEAMRSIYWASELAVLALRYADRVAIIDAQGEATYARVFAKAAGIGRALTAMGVRGGDTVATVFRNGGDAGSASYGVMMSGAVETPLNPVLGVADFRHCLDVSRARVIITSADLAEGVAGAGPAVLSADEAGEVALNPADFPS